MGAGPLVYRDESTLRAWRESRTWFEEHYNDAANQVIEFFGADRIDLRGRRVGDIGCGDGIIDLGVLHKAEPERLVGFDIAPTDTTKLLRMAAEAGAAKALPENLEFRACSPLELPAETDEFDHVFSWSAFEHIEDTVGQLAEVRRVLKPDGVLMIQLWPFYASEHGSHLWGWYPDGFAQFLNRGVQIDQKLRDDPFDDPGWAERMLDIFNTLNRLTFYDLQRSLLANGFCVANLEVMTNPILIPRELNRYPLSMLAIDGVKLLATTL